MRSELSVLESANAAVKEELCACDLNSGKMR